MFFPHFQITVRSSPNAYSSSQTTTNTAATNNNNNNNTSSSSNNDKLSVCRHCHKNCKSKGAAAASSGGGSPSSVSHSLKVQHSQASPNRCCQSISSRKSDATNRSSVSSETTASSSTLTEKSGSTMSDQKQPNRAGLSNGTIAPQTEATRSSGLSGSPATSRNGTAASCNCKCDPKDFDEARRSCQDVLREKCKLIDSVEELNKTSPDRRRIDHGNCKCSCPTSNQDTKRSSGEATTVATKPTTLTNGFSVKSNTDDIDDWSLMLIGLAQIHPTTSLVHMDPFDAVPTISVVPPTPEGLFSKFTGIQLWETKQEGATVQQQQQSSDFSPEDSPQDEEPPYQSLNTSLKRLVAFSLPYLSIFPIYIKTRIDTEPCRVWKNSLPKKRTLTIRPKMMPTKMTMVIKRLSYFYF